MIPKIIHYCWVGNSPKPKSVLYCIESWRKYCPGYEIREWNESNYDFSKNGYMKQAYEAKKWGFVPDYARLDIIYKYGGIYLDTDVELIKSLDELLNQTAFMGFENTGDGEFFVNCGHGFGAEPHNKIIGAARNLYDHIQFINDDNTYNLLPSPHYTTQILKKYGLVQVNKDQKVSDMMVYASDVLCPKNFRTGKIHKSERTISIHHFTASWMDEAIRKEIKHNQKVCNILGDGAGRVFLIIESGWRKYGFFRGIKRLLIHFYEGLYTYLPLITCIIKKNFQLKSKINNIVLFDTALYTKNCGDQIIMENCIKQLSDLIDVSNATHLSTHKIPEKEGNIKGRLKILCGTNILSCKMGKYGLWKLPKDLSGYDNILLMGVGFDSYKTNSDLYTRLLFKYMFSKNGYHSVRDSFSKECLEKMGIKNVLNTGCPTMWGLTENHCKKIPNNKAKNVICTITDYLQDDTNDKIMFDILLSNYDRVYLWLQGDSDLEYLKKLGYESRVEIIPSSLEEYDQILNETDLDYVGTRLHAGIRALSFLHRTIIISIDNRAECISKDTFLPIIKRDKVKNELENKINSVFKTDIRLPFENIDLWKSQFKDILNK